MSTSIAVLPAYRTSKVSRTKARANRTIFGTTLDNSGKAQAVFQNQEAYSSAQQLSKKRRNNKWRTPSPGTQVLLDAAWGIKDYTQAEIAEEENRGYSRLSLETSSCYTQQPTQSESIEPAVAEAKEAKEAKSPTPLLAYKDRFGVYNVGEEKVAKVDHSHNSSKKTGHSPRPLGKLRATRRSRHSSAMSQASYSSSNRKHSQATKGINSVQVPRFPLPPGQRNYLRTASLKITETGAKDLIHARPINKVGLGDTSQYNHESFKKRETPNQYVDHGNVFSLGQKGHSMTTNGEVTGPGGFYKITTPESDTANPSKGDKNESIYSLPYQPSVPHKRAHDATMKNQPGEASPRQNSIDVTCRLDEAVPLNILHKYGADEVRSLLTGKESEIEQALDKARDSRLSHSGMVPPRTNVPELNHPINPPPTYYSNFGQSLKYDKFEGGLHLYIK